MTEQTCAQELTAVEDALLDARESAQDSGSAELVALVQTALRAAQAAQQLAEELGV